MLFRVIHPGSTFFDGWINWREELQGFLSGFDNAGPLIERNVFFIGINISMVFEYLVDSIGNFLDCCRLLLVLKEPTDR